MNNNYKDDFKRIVFIHSTDIHGHIEGQKYKTVDSGEEYTVGGMSRM